MPVETSICPFCDNTFDFCRIKKHVATQHLGLNSDQYDQQTEIPNKSIGKLTKIAVNASNEQATTLCEICGDSFNSQEKQTHVCKTFLLQSPNYESNVDDKLNKENVLCENCGTTLPYEQLWSHTCEPSIPQIKVKTEIKEEILCEPDFTLPYYHEEEGYDITNTTAKGTVTNIYQCDHCDKSFTRKINLEIHKNGKKCNICSKKYNSRTGYLKHLKTCHPNKTISNVKDKLVKEEDNDIVEEEFNFSLVLQVSESSTNTSNLKLEDKPKASILQQNRQNENENILIPNTGYNTKPCEYCGKSFVVSKISAHEQSCKTEYEIRFKGRKYQCNQCRRSFHMKSNLSHHIKVIHERRRFSCEKCTKSFCSNQMLKDHDIKEHSGNGKKCEYCPKQFGRNSKLNFHIQIAHQGFRFECEICAKSFKSKKSVRCHKKVSHQELKVQNDQIVNEVQNDQIVNEAQTDPKVSSIVQEDLKDFVKLFKQKRMELSISQADVGKALSNIDIPGIGTLSQSTISRFESFDILTHSNMSVLKPILSAWLKDAEAGKHNPHLKNGARRRSRTVITPEASKSLKQYYDIQPLPSGEQYSDISKKLNLPRKVIKVWFSNQRIRQKKIKNI